MFALEERWHGGAAQITEQASAAKPPSPNQIQNI